MEFIWWKLAIAWVIFAIASYFFFKVKEIKRPLLSALGVATAIIFIIVLVLSVLYWVISNLIQIILVLVIISLFVGLIIKFTKP